MKQEALYWRTYAGFRAWSCAGSGLPSHYRRILGALHGPMGIAPLRQVLAGYTKVELAAWLEELDTLGFVATGPAAGAYYREAA